MSLIYKIIRPGKNVYKFTSMLSCLQQSRYSSISPNNDPENIPIKYTSSPANKWKAEYSRRGGRQDRLYYEPYVISISLAIFLLYFGVFREENDIDDGLRLTLYDRIEGLEERDLQLAYERNLALGLDTKEISDRLKELQANKI